MISYIKLQFVISTGKFTSHKNYYTLFQITILFSFPFPLSFSLRDQTFVSSYKIFIREMFNVGDSQRLFTFKTTQLINQLH